MAESFIATNMSMMTTAQSDIAADLDAFSETTWFNSAYLVYSMPIRIDPFKTLELTYSPERLLRLVLLHWRVDFLRYLLLVYTSSSPALSYRLASLSLLRLLI
jgi:hypothetical protein